MQVSTVKAGMASSIHMAFQVQYCSVQRPSSVPDNIFSIKSTVSSALKPFLMELRQLPMKIDVSKTIKNASLTVLDAFVDSVFEFADQPLLPSQSNYAPVDELKEAIVLSGIVGQVPGDFPEGVYTRNGKDRLHLGTDRKNKKSLTAMAKVPMSTRMLQLFFRAKYKTICAHNSDAYQPSKFDLLSTI